MRNIYISDTSKDEQDGLTSKTSIRCWERYLKIKSGNDNLVLMINPETILQRLHAWAGHVGKFDQNIAFDFRQTRGGNVCRCVSCFRYRTVRRVYDHHRR
jgi:hypothetical protein